MIRSFRHRGLKLLFERNDPSRVSAAHRVRIERILGYLEQARSPADMNFAGLRLHQLTGQMKGFWSVTVSAIGASSFASKDRTSSTSTWSTIIEDLLMAMLKAHHPGEGLREDVIIPLGLTITETAKALGISRKTLSEVVNGKSPITPDIAVRLERAFGNPSADMWLRLQAAYDLQHAQAKLKDTPVRRLWNPKPERKRRAA